MNSTIKKFGYPDSLVYENDHWVVLLRPKQVTLGSLILASKSEADSLSGLTSEDFVSLGQITKKLESALNGEFEYDKINYLALMMKDKHVHFHVFPRYESSRSFSGVEFVDAEWPGAPSTSNVTEMTSAAKDKLLDTLKGAFAS